jgi:hypothetical protein
VAFRRNKVEGVFNPDLPLPYELRPQDFELAIQDLYDLFFDINGTLLQKGLGLPAVCETTTMARTSTSA